MPRGSRQNRAGRNRARRLLMQALYQMFLNEQPLRDIQAQFDSDKMLEGVDVEFFSALIKEADQNRERFDEIITRLADRPIAQIDPVERAVLYGAMAEFSARIDVPYRVVISEAVSLTKKFGATDGHLYVNAILDRAALELRPQETAVRQGDASRD
ncbi:MAG: transcription antitermination factor NusB [Gammaproteobacteria bacterium]|nr:transcription antitermination factor NusB [Gammaproteobacteria bacterium]